MGCEATEEKGGADEIDVEDVERTAQRRYEKEWVILDIGNILYLLVGQLKMV